MSKQYDEYFKLLIVRQYLRDQTSLREVAHQHCVDESTVRQWVENYRQHGMQGLHKKYTHRSAAFEVLETMWRDGLSRRQTAALFDILADGSSSIIVESRVH